MNITATQVKKIKKEGEEQTVIIHHSPFIVVKGEVSKAPVNADSSFIPIQRKPLILISSQDVYF
jgi:hypothetical protein